MSLAAYVLIAAGAAVPWSLHQAFIGAVVARLLTGAPLLAVIVSIVVALTVGVPLDLVLTKRWGVPRGTDERAAGGRDPGLSEPDERVD